MKIIQRPFLGELEIAVLEYLWANGAFDANRVHAALGKTRGISHNTIQSTLERLYKKQLLTRQKVSRAYVYQTSVSRNELMGRIITDVVHTLVDGDADSMLAAFVDITARSDEAHLERLEQLISEYRSKRCDKTPS